MTQVGPRGSPHQQRPCWPPAETGACEASGSPQTWFSHSPCGAAVARCGPTRVRPPPSNGRRSAGRPTRRLSCGGLPRFTPSVAAGLAGSPSDKALQRLLGDPGGRANLDGHQITGGQQPIDGPGGHTEGLGGFGDGVQQLDHGSFSCQPPVWCWSGSDTKVTVVGKAGVPRGAQPRPDGRSSSRSFTSSSGPVAAMVAAITVAVGKRMRCGRTS